MLFWAENAGKTGGINYVITMKQLLFFFFFLIKMLMELIKIEVDWFLFNRLDFSMMIISLVTHHLVKYQRRKFSGMKELLRSKILSLVTSRKVWYKMKKLPWRAITPCSSVKVIWVSYKMYDVGFTLFTTIVSNPPFLEGVLTFPKWLLVLRKGVPLNGFF